ncbi:hypothetical protein [Streptomyces sp. NPDC056670]|uniref:hypothetical protein n=1 Tax=Streptomyces sp. NPDC056670 TaxID=3345904 RepID=UPI0036D1E1A0
MNTHPLCCHSAPAMCRSRCCSSWWSFSDWTQRAPAEGHCPRTCKPQTPSVSRSRTVGSHPGAKLPSARDLLRWRHRRQPRPAGAGYGGAGQERFGTANSTAQNALRLRKEEGLIYSVQGWGVLVRRLSPRELFLKRYNESLEQSAAQGRAGEGAIRLSGETDDEVAAELEDAEESFAKASIEFEAATAHREAMRAVMEQRNRLSGNCTPEEKAAKAQLLRDRFAEARRRR